MLRYFFAVMVMIFCIRDAEAQDVAGIRHKKKLLKGRWQLVKTVNNGTPHAIAKDEYDAVITFKCFHNYQEEVTYEGYHWIIKGKWKVYRKKADLELMQTEYISGAPPDARIQTIRFSLYQLDKIRWGGDTETKTEKIKMEYERLPKRK
ncbi:MAG: hypothetical protein JWO03_4032 [Bacteroidetes bacterium]|nr:hypothetical protein [Bacteroidota bacterium]